MLAQRIGLDDRLTTVQGRLEDEGATIADWNNHKELWKIKRAVDHDIERLQQEIERRAAEQMNAGQPAKWKRREHKLFRELTAQYAGRGPVYELLCQRLAEITVLMEQRREAGSGDADEYVKLMQAQNQTIAQLQKYTEATKSESLSKEAREVALGLMRVIEGIVAPRAPELWSDVVQGVKSHIMQVETEPRFAVLPRPDAQKASGPLDQDTSGIMLENGDSMASGINVENDLGVAFDDAGADDEPFDIDPRTVILDHEPVGTRS